MTVPLFVGDEALERAVLAAAITDRSSLEVVVGDLEPKHFAWQRHRQIFTAARELYRERRDVDVRTVSARISDDTDTLSYVATMDKDLPDYASLPSYLAELRGFAVRRSLLRFSEAVQRSAADRAVSIEELLDEAEVVVMESRRVGSSRDAETAESLSVVVEDVISGRHSTGSPTGFVDLDRMVLGMEPGHLWILAARPGMGKTLWALTVAMHVAQSQPVAFFSLEMPAREVSLRMLSSVSRIPHRRLRRRDLSPRDHEELRTVANVLGDQSLLRVFEQARMTVGEIGAQCRRLLARDGRLGLVVIDYLGLMDRPKAERDDLALGMVSTALKQMAKELGVPVLLIHQLNRQLYERSDKRPLLGDLRGSGQLEQDADLVLFLHWDWYYKPDPDHPEKERILDCIVAKNRHGETGIVQLYWNPDVMHVGDLFPERRSA